MSNDLVSSDNWQTIIEESEPLLDKVFSDGKGNTYQFIDVIHASDDYYYGMTNTLGKLKMLSCVVDLKGHGYKLITDSDNITAKTIRFDDKYLHVELEDGRVISTPMNWYKELQNASLIWEDTRKDYGECRLCALGFIGERLHNVVFTIRDNIYWIISLRKANKREVKRYEAFIKAKR